MPKKVVAREISTSDMLEMVVGYVGEQDGGGLLALIRREPKSGGGLEWYLHAEFGKEAEDSPMAGGAAYGVDPDLRVALEQVASDCGLIEREEQEGET